MEYLDDVKEILGIPDAAVEEEPEDLGRDENELTFEDLMAETKDLAIKELPTKEDPHADMVEKLKALKP